MASIPRGRPFAVLLALVTVVAMAGPAVGAADASQQPSGDEILDRVEQRYDDAETVVGQAVVTTPNGSATTTANVSFAYAAPNSSRLVVERDGETYRTGSNGTIAWSVGPQGTAVWGASGPGAPNASGLSEGEGALAWAVPTDVDASNADATLVGTTEIDAVPAYELDVERPDDDSVTTLWVARDDHRVLRAATTSGTQLTVVDVEEVRFDVSVHGSTFQPPEDRLESWSFDRYDSFDAAQDATDLDLPELDDGTFRRATVTTQRGETIAAQRYELDGENVTVATTTATDRFEAFAENASAVQLDGRTASVGEFRNGSVVLWTEENVTTAVVVEGSTDRAVEVAERVEE